MRELRDHLGTFLERVDNESDPQEALARLEEILLSNLPRQLERLREALGAKRIELASLPPELKERLVAEDGRARVQIFPSLNLRNEESIRQFTSEVASVDPTASGIAFNLVAFEESTKASFRQALISAIVLITILLLWLWRSISDTLLVLAPLMLSAVL
jgi:predicted RND superfamily exporter protein